jgi:hypothetical protein
LVLKTQIPARTDKQFLRHTLISRNMHVCLYGINSAPPISLTGITLCLLGTLFMLSCAATPPPLAWVLDTEAAYPRESYIAQPGRGSGRQEAELVGLEAISRYFASEVQSSVSAKRSYTEQDGAASQTTRVDEQVFVQSQTKLFAVRYTDAWHNPATGEWEVLACIDRAEAWAIYEPALRQKADAFRSLYQAAETSGEPLKQFYLYSAARGLAPELERLLDFAAVLHPGKAQGFRDIQNAAAGLPRKADSARTGASIYIDCPVDHEGAVYSALVRAFGSLSFPLEKNRKAASAVCGVEVNENAQVLEAGTFYTPRNYTDLGGQNRSAF